ncbi:thiosulfate sulfurtransferase-like [Mya arenaria]|uniref:thiosulfate sulfurtransferase-like n=1 Tax=Mya arenaria TaxID=6604 RepID=UPI0022DF39F3|nr:thiosulfate sulfurtransferase-like [Mya arenaria]XP_052765884.1 thiosulfate sulfurtransferase-like [Mya arenaria]
MVLSRIWTVVSTNWLREQIGSQLKASKKLRILDTTFAYDRDVDTYKEGYQLGHIPQSVHFNIFKCTQSTPEIPVNLPEINCFTDYVQGLGIWPDTHVIAYDRSLPQAAYRTWWMLRLYGHRNVSVLDGGLRKWLEDGYDVTTDEPEIERSDFVAKLDKNLLRSYDDVIRNFETRREQIVDARGEQSKNVTDAEGGGTLKGAKHVDFQQMFAEDGTLKPDAELKALFDRGGVDLGRPIVASCQRGMTACAIAAAAQILGKENVPVYLGSWSEFSLRAPEEFKHTPKTV